MRTNEGRGGPGYEVRDVNARGVGLLTLGLAVAVGAAMVLMVALFGLFSTEASRIQQQPVSLAGAPDAIPPEPRLQSHPARDLDAMRAAEQAMLDGYAWVDRGNGIVSIPIQQAMERVVARGLPVRGAAPVDAPAPEEARP